MLHERQDKKGHKTTRKSKQNYNFYLPEKNPSHTSAVHMHFNEDRPLPVQVPKRSAQIKWKMMHREICAVHCNNFKKWWKLQQNTDTHQRRSVHSSAADIVCKTNAPHCTAPALQTHILRNNSRTPSNSRPPWRSVRSELRRLAGRAASALSGGAV